MPDDDNLVPREPVLVRHPTSYHFRFPHGAWAIFTIDDEAGTFQIQSDWGDYAHRWNPAHLGEKTPTLTSFLASCDAHYIVDKLHYGREREQFDGKATATHLREQIAERLANSTNWEDGRLDETMAAELTSDANELQHAMSEEEAMVMASDELKRRFEPLYEHFVRSPTHRFTFLVEKLIPFFQAQLKDLGRKEPEPEPSAPAGNVEDRALDLGA